MRPGGPFPTPGPLFPGDGPLSDAEVWALGYDPDGWVLVEPELPGTDPTACRGCRKFQATLAARLCPGCTWFGKGDPHGLRRDDEATVRVPFRPVYDPGDLAEISECRDCRGYLATGPDRVCDGCAWERSATPLSFTEWREVQRQLARRVRGAA